MKITVDGSVVYLGPCETGVYVRMGRESQGDSPIPVLSTESLGDTVALRLAGLLVDYSDEGDIIGVEILAPLQTEKRPP